MKKTAKNLSKFIAIKLSAIGFDLKKILALRHLVRFFKERRSWLRQGGRITHNFMVLHDYHDEAGTASGHYFHQDLLVANFIYQAKPRRHVDVASRLDGFVAHVASFREIEMVDTRPINNFPHENIKFSQYDFTKTSNLGTTDSLSCLHAIEHFGLGRYGDPIDKNGHIKGLKNLIDLLEEKGRLYLSFPIGQRDEVHFNAHRVFHPETILNQQIVQKNLTLLRFDYVDDRGELIKNTLTKDVCKSTSYGCGIYTFERKKLNTADRG